MQRPAQDAAYYIGYTCILYFYLMRAIDIETLRGLIVIDVAISYIYSVTWTHVRDPYSYINKFTVISPSFLRIEQKLCLHRALRGIFGERKCLW